MSLKVSDRRAALDVSLGAGLVGAAFAWWFLYRVNGPVWDWAVYRAAGLDPDGRLGETIHFFVFDTTKILLLLSGIIFIVTVLRSFMSLERTRALLGGKREGSPTSRRPGSGSPRRSAPAARCRPSWASSRRACRSASRSRS